jgi:DNA-directed RNA polymerase subunit RPC12/RpoP
MGTRSFTLLCGAALWIIADLAAIAAAQPVGDPAPEKAAPFELTYDFRGSKPLPPGFQLAGNVQDLTVKPEEAGLRLRLSGTQPNGVGRAGLEMKTTLRGDFSFTAGYEILRAESPTKGNGVGFEMYAHTVQMPQQGFGIYRMEQVDRGELYLVSRAYLKEDGKLGWRNKHIDTTAKSGRLRITRTGTQATAWAAEGKDLPFKKLSSDELGKGDIKVIWLMAYTGHVSHPLELRLTDLEIRSGAPIPVAAAPPPEEAPPPPASPMLFWWIGIGVAFVFLVTLLGASSWIIFRYLVGPRRGSQAGSELSIGRPAAIAFTCGGCGKALKVSAANVGKKVKCPYCGQLTMPGQEGS